ncbi:hypothetical protein FB563_1067 [Streptomyces puniciscabiei]|uniref:DUF3137 domain-containing protein n=1 Tax=Streptomyces puniciscabiei TaxID=164348 RepID=A0A542UAL8_9ACTN|nr:hypothetical protein [Streptomyces puniciscabiei]TQK96134.1 hypothetical protein FB563_1067 [Streptomyces puniciscabiei]
MTILMPVLMILVVGGLFAFVISMMVRAQRSRARGMQERTAAIRLAQERGWSYQQTTYGTIDRLCGMAPLPNRGHNLRASHYITGEFRGRRFCCFEYTTGTLNINDGPGRTQPAFWTVFAVTAPAAGPELVVRRPQALDGVTQHGRLVQLGVPGFDEAFRVFTDDESFARDALTSGVAPFLVTDPRATKDAPVRLHNDELLTWRRGRLSPADLDERLGYLCDVLDRIPAGVWSPA